MFLQLLSANEPDADTLTFDVTRSEEEFGYWEWFFTQTAYPYILIAGILLFAVFVAMDKHHTSSPGSLRSRLTKIVQEVSFIAAIAAFSLSFVGFTVAAYLAKWDYHFDISPSVNEALQEEGFENFDSAYLHERVKATRNGKPFEGLIYLVETQDKGGTTEEETETYKLYELLPTGIDKFTKNLDESDFKPRPRMVFLTDKANTEIKQLLITKMKQNGYEKITPQGGRNEVFTAVKDGEEVELYVHKDRSNFPRSTVTFEIKEVIPVESQQ